MLGFENVKNNLISSFGNINWKSWAKRSGFFEPNAISGDAKC